jgi:hypothetical protein
VKPRKLLTKITRQLGGRIKIIPPPVNIIGSH